MQPAGRLAPQPWMTAPATRAVLEALSARGASVRFVGGCVRDAVAERPVTDIDIATPDAPEGVIELLQAAGVKALPTGIEHGTVTAVIEGQAIEITTLRRDLETDGRRAVVAYTDDWLADSARRDLTINALYADADGTLYDPQSGLGDLKAGRVRFVGDPAQRIAEDVLRILRFFRFQASLGSSDIDQAGYAACVAAAATLERLSGERIAREMFKLLAAEYPAPTLQRMVEGGILQQVVPGHRDLAALRDLCGLERQHGLADALRRLAALLSDASAAQAVATRWRLSNKDASRLAAMLTPPAEFAPGLAAPEQRRLLYRQGPERVLDWLLLAGADDLSPALSWQAPVLPLSGQDVLDLGLAPGPRVGDTLRAVEEWWIEGDFSAGREACLDQARRLIM